MSKLLLIALSSWSLVGAHEILMARNAMITARAIFEPMGNGNIIKRDQSQCFSTNYTPCPDGSGCCPQGAACFKSNSVGLCSVTCGSGQPQCVFNGVSACCGMGEACGGSVCIPGSMPTSAPSPTPTPPSVTTTTTAAAVVSSVSSVSSASLPASSSSCPFNTAGLTTIPIPTTGVPLPTSSSSVAATCKSPSVYCTWPATTVYGSSTVTLTGMSGCCAGGCNPSSPGICLPTTITSTSVVAASTSKTTAAIATVASAGASRILMENSWAIGLAGLLFGL